MYVSIYSNFYYRIFEVHCKTEIVRCSYVIFYIINLLEIAEIL